MHNLVRGALTLTLALALCITNCYSLQAWIKTENSESAYKHLWSAEIEAESRITVTATDESGASVPMTFRITTHRVR